MPTPPSPRRFTLNEIFNTETFREQPLSQPHWMKDGRRLSYLDRAPASERQAVWLYDLATRTRKPLFNPETLRLPDREETQAVHTIQWSPDERFLLLPERAPARFQPCGNLYLYAVETGAFRAITDTEELQRNAKFSPDGRLLGLVRGDNLWTISLETGEERQWTFDASSTVYNGRFGWVYEEELALVDGWVWSPDGTQVAYFQQDETDVPPVLLPQYDDLHMTPRPTRYPKAGDPNPRTRIGILTLATGETRWLDLSPDLQDLDADFYLARMQWTPDGSSLLIQRIPRLQNRLDLLLADAQTGSVTTVLTEDDAAWVDAPGDVTFLSPDGTGKRSKQFLWPSERDGWNHLYLYDLSGQCLQQLTRGVWDVEAVAGVDTKAEALYFTAARPDPTERHIYRTTLEGGGEPACLTEGVTGWHRPLMAEHSSSLTEGPLSLHTHSTMNTPATIVVRDAQWKLLDTLLPDTLPKLSKYARGEWENLTFTTSDGETLYARMLKPKDFDPARQYPVLMYTYGGPGSQVVTNRWGGTSHLWYHLLAQQGYVLFMVDNRGTGGRGRDFKKQVYLKLGEWETHDQIEGAQYLARLPYVDPKRIGIWGWSYGGYMAALCYLKGADVFRAAVAVAPTTDWALYDTIYTERYMQRPCDNETGYLAGSPARLTDEMKRMKGRFLLMHGTMDDNVHFQHSVRLANALQDAQRPFEFMLYPGKAHGIEDRHFHLYMTMTAFLKRNL